MKKGILVFGYMEGADERCMVAGPTVMFAGIIDALSLLLTMMHMEAVHDNKLSRADSTTHNLPAARKGRVVPKEPQPDT